MTAREPANRGLLWLLSLVLVTCAGCATTTHYPVKPQPLQDRSADTDYNLDRASAKLADAERWQMQGKRPAAAAIYAAAIELLDGQPREQDYVRLLCAAMWAEAGDGRKEANARELLVATSQRAATDIRFRADHTIASASLELGSGAYEAATRMGHIAISLFNEAGAFARGADAALQLAAHLRWAGQDEPAIEFLRAALQTGRQLRDDIVLIEGSLALAAFDKVPEHDPESLWLDAYEAAHRLNEVGWRNLVVAGAVRGHARAGDGKAVLRWGSRFRDQELGVLPTVAESGLGASEYAPALAEYALAVAKHTPKDPRVLESLESARAALDELAAELGGQMDDEAAALGTKVNDSLLQLGAGK